MRTFQHVGLPSRVIFGRGAIASLADVIASIGGTRALLLSTPQQEEQSRNATAAAESLIVAQFAGAAMHTPTDVTERALSVFRDSQADCVISFGGGSTIGLGKALALQTDVAQVAIATTYAGSEMTPILGQTSNGRKTTERTLKVLPEAVIYDVDLTFGLPPSMSGTSGINAIAHAVEGLYAQQCSPIMRLVAEEGVRAMADALPRVITKPDDADARSDALYGAWLCGTVLGSVGMALHHKLCHTLGGMFDLPHAETHAVILPHALAYNAADIPDAMTSLRRALSSDDPADTLFELGRAVKAPSSLREMGMPESGIDQAANQAVENPYWNPRPIEREAIRALIACAWHGERPKS